MAAKKTLCVDFDGVLHSYTSGWAGLEVIKDAPVSGAMEFLYDAVRVFNVCVFSSRSATPQGIKAMQQWLDWHASECNFDYGRPWWLQIEWPIHKPAAFVTIDDRAIQFTGSWPSMNELFNFKTWFEQQKAGHEVSEQELLAAMAKPGTMQEALSHATDLLKKGEV
jgi:hypothetical protein